MMRISPRQLGIDHRPPPHCGSRTRTRERPFAHGFTRALVGLALSALIALPGAAEKEQAAKQPEDTAWYAQTFARGDARVNVTHLWALKSQFRAETVARGHKLVTIVRGDTYYVYDEIALTGVAIRRAPAAIAADSRTPRPFGNEAQILLEDGGEKIREEVVSGQPADVYQITDEEGRRVVWVTQDDRRLPIRIEVFGRKTGATRYKEYVDWVIGLPLTDAFFEPDPGVKFERFELDEFIEKTLERDPVAAIPILYGELLHGRAPR
ncbi:MAG: DUF2092 domain-containing protein [Deltaproteobacteria bacterium]|nr:DUF2092 domain-containing protein [Deltaproteobacteria bacterium]